MIPNLPADISIPQPVLGIASIIALLLAILTLLRGCTCIRASRPWRASIYALLSLSLFASSISGLLTSLNVHSYQRLSGEKMIANINFKELGTQYYLATISFIDSDTSQEFYLRGDEWQVSARLIKWKAPLTLLGFDNLYRLDRIEGRYRDIEQARAEARSIFALATDSKLDLWSVSRKYATYLPWLDAFYGSAVYLPMNDDASFAISIGLSGLLARPVNRQATGAIQGWQ